MRASTNESVASAVREPLASPKSGEVVVADRLSIRQPL